MFLLYGKQQWPVKAKAGKGLSAGLFSWIVSARTRTRQREGSREKGEEESSRKQQSH
jgi:hypothetical protein